MNALQDAGAEAEGATVYCTLEPCAHWGRTGPCCVALTDANVSKVIVGIRDPFPAVDGKGIDHLREHDVEVDVGYCEEIIKQDLAEFLAWAKEQSSRKG